MLFSGTVCLLPLRERKSSAHRSFLGGTARESGAAQVAIFRDFCGGDRLTVGGSFWRRPTGHELTDQVTKQEADDKPNERNHGAFGHR